MNGNGGLNGHACDSAHSNDGSSKRSSSSKSLDHREVWYEVPDAPVTYPGRSEELHASLWATLFGYYTWISLIIVGKARDWLGAVFGRSRYRGETQPPEGYAPLFKSFENFYTRRLYNRIQDCWNRPICSAPGSTIEVMERSSEDGMKSLSLTGSTKRMLNLGSYNYLGFGDDWRTTCKPGVVSVLDNFPVGMAASRQAFGSTTEHRELEKLVARFLGKEDAVVFNMGYGTNASTIPALMGKGDLIISDTLNHMSIVSGCRASGAQIRVFQHNDAEDLEEVLKEAIVMGMPRTRRPWKKILVMVEGIYSMEGEVVDLKPIVRVAKKYKAYVYLDEAHSIGALGLTGRGACEYCGVDPADVDILMGTFTKSFGGMGGYIAADKHIVDYLRVNCAGMLYHNSMSPVVARQVFVALQIIMGEDGTDIGASKLKALRDNSNFVRHRLTKMGLHVYGDYNSPVIPVVLYVPGKMAAFSRECYKRSLAVVVVCFPATSLHTGRTRLCVSAGHKKRDLEIALDRMHEVVNLIKIKYKNNMFGL